MLEKEYLELLERAYRVITPKAARRSEIPKVRITLQPRKTIIENLGEIAKRLGRDPVHIARFIQKELAMPAQIEGDRLIIHGERTPRVVEVAYERYLKLYVICPVCSSIDTELVKEERVLYLICTACGARTPVRSV